MVMRSLVLLVIFSIAHSSVLLAQELDETFHSAVPFRAAYTTCLVKQPDGNLLMGGDIDYYNNTPVQDLIRIRPDGSRDASFSFASPEGFYVHDLALRTNGEIVLLMRKFGSYKNVIYPSSRLVVLNSDGTQKAMTDISMSATTMAVQNDGKILVGGSTENGGLVVRYTENLAEDLPFNTAVSFDRWVAEIKVAGDKIFLAGIFHKVNGVTKNSIVKLNLDGSIDNSFDTGDGTTDYIGALTIAPDGKILPGETYINSFDGHPRRGNVRLNADGSVDDTFGLIDMHGMMTEALITTDGIYTFSYFELNGIYGRYLIRLSDDGSADPAFEPVLVSMEQTPFTPIVTPVGDNLLVAGSIAEGNPYQLSRIDKSGIVDPAFAPRISRVGVIQFGDEQNEKIIVGGDFVRIDSVNTFGMARLNSDGSVDETFAASQNFGVVAQMHLFDDETALVSTNKYFFKLDNHGNVMPDFNWTPGGAGGFLHQVNQFRLLDNNQIVVGDPNTIARLNADGSIDDSFYVGHISNSTAFGFDLQGDSIIYGRTVWVTGDEFQAKVDRITPEAVFDPSFRVETGPGATEGNTIAFVTMVKVLDNKEILIGGAFQTFDGLPVAHGLVKLSRDGKIDEAFNANQLAAPGPYSFFDSQVEQIGSKVYIRGDSSIYVINLDGTVDGWDLPVTVEGISGIVSNNTADAPANGRAKSDDRYILALGSFQSAQTDKHLAVVKIKITEKTEEPGTVTGVENKLATLALDVYPQPTSGTLHVRFEDKTGFRAAVYNSSGVKLIDQDFHNLPGSDVASLDVSQIPPGFYTLEVVSKSGKSGYSKFIRVP